MKRIIIIGLAVLLPVMMNVMAEDDVKVPIIKKQQLMVKLQQKGEYRAAMAMATSIISEQEDNRVAIDFVHSHWDKMVKETQKELGKVSDPTDLEQSKKRCQIYEEMVEINDNLQGVRMPFYGTGNKWVWQPEIIYYQGHYDEERNNVLWLIKREAKDALLSYDAETARLLYEDLLVNYLERDGERNSNRKLMVSDCNEIMYKHVKSEKVYDQIFVYELCGLSLWLDENQSVISAIQKETQKRISEMYAKMAEDYLQVGDSTSYNEYMLSSEEWK